MKVISLLSIVFFLILSILFTSCGRNIIIKSGDLQIEFDNGMYSKFQSLSEGTNVFMNDFQMSEYLVTKNFTTDKFKVQKVTSHTLNEKLGVGTETIIEGEFKDQNIGLKKIVKIQIYNEFPDAAFFNISYINIGQQELEIKRWVNHNYKVLAQQEQPGFWSFQGSSSADREDWVKQLNPGFYRKNFMGMNQSDYGGGIPVIDIWRKDGGIAIGHTEIVPEEVALPVDYDKYSDFAQIDIEKEFDDFSVLNIGDTLNTLSTFISIHPGDYFTALRLFSGFMQKKGIEFVEAEDAAFESIWCGWGYERKFTAREIINTLPKVKELGIKWAVIDDGFQIAEGDWRVDKKRFPGGDNDMKNMVDAVHAQGLKAKLWWAPLAADPGSKVLEENPEALLINKMGSPQYITWWDSYYLSPASEQTFSYTKETIEMFFKKWGFDGLKMDGQHMNAVPADYNWSSPREYPEKSIQMLPVFFKMIYKTAREIKPHAILENCPCGTCMSFYNMPYTNQTVASDPLSSWQIRHKGKTYKAIMPHTAYYGDHVELSDNGSDFASSFGIGAVLGTKFTWPKDNPNVKTSYLLTPEKEVVWKKWFSLYNEKMLSKEAYLGSLYDIGYDKPETHVIQKADTAYYAFYDKMWDGKIELRGLDKNKNYIANDYFNSKKLEVFKSENKTFYIETKFNNYLLIEVFPIMN